MLASLLLTIAEPLVVVGFRLTLQLRTITLPMSWLSTVVTRPRFLVVLSAFGIRLLQQKVQLRNGDGSGRFSRLVQLEKVQSISLGYSLGVQGMHGCWPLAMVEQGTILVFDCLAHTHHRQPFLDQVRMGCILVHEADVHKCLHQLVLQSSKVVLEYKGLLVTTRRQRILQHRQGQRMVVLTSVLRSLDITTVVGRPLGEVLAWVLTWEPRKNPIPKNVEALDRRGLNALEKLYPDFRERLRLSHQPLLNFFLESRLQRVEERGNSGTVILLVILIILVLLGFHQLGNRLQSKARTVHHH